MAWSWHCGAIYELPEKALSLVYFVVTGVFRLLTVVLFDYPDLLVNPGGGYDVIDIHPNLVLSFFLMYMALFSSELWT